ncbi:LysM peptidoglycan-binding domain-containing protein [Anaerobacillus alkaliphilus]|uniref:LysM peptidoglycan-binding domain-containing protein n=1 Tax=Anaerobacillus alkaliphilus TaxID=1548597 RepID=A0A4Q0VYZ3_9BACI|nr:LysM peptidoglycan-binding domain-containing protein [Anaerobacillus alkaliphilus]RXJ03851.1 LysM peptidoglycan-binding domain-containing protein [Anaerobacillus alkaliphilus]
MKKLFTCIMAFLMIPMGSALASSTTTVQDSVIQTGMKYLGAPYQFGAAVGDTTRFDCSSFSAQIFAENGIILPRVSRDQARVGVAVSRTQLQKGDLVFYDTNFDGQINHLGVYIQPGQMIHASSSIGVSITDPFSSYWNSRFVTARRVIPEQQVTIARQAQDGVYTVRSGDSLSVIARDFGVTVTQIRQWNNLTSDVIQIGQRLFVTERTVVTTQVQPTNTTIHTVRSGDTLWSISRQYDVTIDQLMTWNTLSNSVIHIGQSLLVSQPQNTQTYVVKSGDSLWRIATNHNVTVDRLMALNNLQSSVIHVGQVLRVS